MKAIHKIASVIITILVLCFINVFIIHNVALVSAESYESSVGLSFTLNPTITLTVSGDLSINNLFPGDYKDSNIITITAESNAVSGYSLSSTVGNSTNTSPSFNNTNLNHTNGTNTFTNLSTNKTSLSAFDENNNTWGYSWCIGTCNAGTDPSLWVSGSLGSTVTGYNGLPIYTTDSPIQLVNSSTSGASTISFKIGARSTTNQLAGEYTNVINFTALAKPNPTPIYIQDLTLSQCQVNVGTNGNSANIGDNITVVDRRDSSIYTVRYINGACWMTQNLRFTGASLSPTTSNVTQDTRLTYYSLDSNDASYANHCDDTNGYNYACIKDSNSDTTGVWYNYYAATAGTIATNNNTTDATEDICPSGWHLPSGPNTTEGTDINKLIGNTTSGWQPPTINLTSFNAAAGGSYYNGQFSGSKAGCWWTATAYDTTLRYRLIYDSYNSRFVGNEFHYRYNGLFLRCLLSS